MTKTLEPVSLYQRYRPQRFADLVGQEVVAESLREAVANDRISHAFLFEGPRGTGKTSTARILAKALNCESPSEPGEPCNNCTSCDDINSGVFSLDYSELDMGSSGGVDSIRDIIQKTSLASPGRYRVLVLDEAHLMSASAASALLKFLEESPNKVVTVLCTTDHQKLLPTILSRVQRRRFRLADHETMLAHVNWVLSDSGNVLSQEQIEAALLDGGGSFRDTLSAIETIIATGVTPQSHAHNLVEAMADADVPKVLSLVAEAVKGGEPPRGLAEELFSVLRELFFVQMNASEVLTTPDWGNRSQVAQTMGAKRTVKAMELLGEGIVGMQGGGDGRVALEIALARFCSLPKG